MLSSSLEPLSLIPKDVFSASVLNRDKNKFILVTRARTGAQVQLESYGGFSALTFW